MADRVILRLVGPGPSTRAWQRLPFTLYWAWGKGLWETARSRGRERAVL